MEDYLVLKAKVIADYSDDMLIGLTNIDSSGSSVDATKLESSCKDAIAIFEEASRQDYDQENYGHLYDGSRLVIVLLKNKGDFNYEGALYDLKQEIADKRYSIAANSIFRPYSSSANGSSFDFYFE